MKSSYINKVKFKCEIYYYFVFSNSEFEYKPVEVEVCRVKVDSIKHPFV